MKALILAEEKVKTAKPSTMEIPSSMIQIDNKPVLEHQINLLKKYNITDITILSNYFQEAIISYFGKGEKLGVDISYNKTTETKILKRNFQEDFILLYGSLIFDIHLDALLKFHKTNNSECTLVLHPSNHPLDSNLVEITEKQEIIKFLSKPYKKNIFFTNLASEGIYILNPSFFDFIKHEIIPDLEQKTFPSICNNLKTFGYVTSEYIKDISQPEELKKAIYDYKEGKIARGNYKNKQKAIFLDRDGVINVERSYIKDPKDFDLYNYTPKAIKKINQSDYKAIVITNQSAIARNISTLEELNIIHKKMETELGNKGAYINGLYFCPHHPDKSSSGKDEYKIDCNCRKPKPGMLLHAAKDFNIDLKQSIMLGDTQRDLFAGKNAGCYTAGVMSGHGMKESVILPDFLFLDLLDATNFLTNKNYEKLFEQIICDIPKNTPPYILGIAGTASSGKSNLASFLKMRLEQNELKVLKIELDNWLESKTPYNKTISIQDRYKIHQLEKDLNNILRREKVTLNPPLKHPKWEDITINYSLDDAEIIIIEGAISLNTAFLRNLLTNSIFITTKEEKRIKRFEKLCKWQGLSQNEIEATYLERFLEENKYLEKDMIHANLILSN